MFVRIGFLDVFESYVYVCHGFLDVAFPSIHPFFLPAIHSTQNPSPMVKAMFHFQHCNNQNKSSNKRYLDAAWVGHGHLVHIIRLAIFARVQAHRVHPVVQLLLIWRKTSLVKAILYKVDRLCPLRAACPRWDRWAFLRFEAEVGTFWRGKKRYVTRGGANWPCLAIAIEFDIDIYNFCMSHTSYCWLSFL